MRLGGPLYVTHTEPGQWVQALRERGYRAAYCPIEPDAPQDLIDAYAAAAREANIVIAEVGAWSNPLAPDEAVRRAALAKCRKSLALAEAIGARCCVNIAGSKGPKWDGPCRDDLTDETFDLIVQVVRDIIDDVRPQRSCYSLETMPWMFPDSTDSYLALIKAIDRKAFAVHFDPVNLICSPQIYFRNGQMIRDFIARLGPQIRSVHAKDILMRDSFMVHLDEVRPGKGTLDYTTLLTELAKLDPDMPLMLEHLPNADEYTAAAEHVRQMASAANVPL